MGSLYRCKHELCFIYKSGTAPHINNIELGAHGRYRTNVWDYAGANVFGAGKDDLKLHPTVKAGRNATRCDIGRDTPGLDKAPDYQRSTAQSEIYRCERGLFNMAVEA